ncbi:MAG: class I adenylate-forming enzyme family protein [Sphingomonadaceae bacterium]
MAPLRLVSELVARAGQDHPGKEAIALAGERVTWGALAAATDSLAAALVREGVSRGDRVVIQLENGWKLAAALSAVLRADAVMVVVDPRLPPERLAFIVKDSGARALIADGRRPDQIGAARAAAVGPLAVFASGGTEGAHELEEALAGAMGSSPPPQRALTIDLAALIYTSGSTGQPKGVMHTHQSMLFALGSLLEYIGVRADDRIQCALPLAFDYGLYQFLMAAATGATLVLDGGSAFIGDLVAALRDEAVTVFPGVPTLYAMLAKAHARQPLAIPGVRLLTSTAADLSPTLHAPLREIFPNAQIIRMYGLTECKRVSYLPPDLLDAKPDSVGIPIPGTEVMVCDDQGREVPNGTPGILHVRGAHVMLGYWNRPEATAKMLRPGSHSSDRVLVTGDLFVRDADGHLRFLGRTDDILKTRGEKVAPLEVEAALLAIDGVHEAAVVGMPDPVLGDAIVAFVSGTIENERFVRKGLVGRLPPQMMPTRILLLGELPKTPNGKIDRRALAASLLAEAAA